MTPHISAKPGEIAKTVLMPGCPLRAKFLAEKYLESPVLVNSVRNMFMYTGTYKEKPVSICASGMGCGSMGIYSHELFNDYGVENIIRIGTCGAYTTDINVNTSYLVTETYGDMTDYLEILTDEKSHLVYPSAELNKKIEESAKKLGLTLNSGRFHCTNAFYNTKTTDYLAKMSGAKLVEMETYSLFVNAKLLGKHAAAILTVTDNIATKTFLDSTFREKCILNSAEIALGVL
ncbi:uridine phosphorylase [Babesia microti strain RI]|uniref:Uridine phosphorylase n=1 Tax=Babesia microti (strain RI) TaxID=1133968 RepID=I7ISY0_BABMR|nr:uridine phosphorylase [Babesia microti strain RI]CCF75951.1 uridine phosphorylase [Babesia microti strain RI]|eukprot:XP_012650359.1 uridine phosphorylase [Babesia microti strain RI]